jgi:uncharacterized RDD family membrane protein YckC
MKGAPDAHARRFFVVRTPEQVAFRYELAGPVERLCALALDLACVWGALVALWFVFIRLGTWGQALFTIAAFVVNVGYFLWFEWRWAGQTPGKRALGIRVIQTKGVRCTLDRVVLRNFLRLVDALPFAYALGGLLVLFTREGRRLGDWAAGTVCVRVPAPPAPEEVAQIQRRHNSLQEDPVARERIRQVLDAPEVALVTSLALRRELLEEASREPLFARCAAHLRRRLRLGDRHEGLPDESLVLNVASVCLSDRVL